MTIRRNVEFILRRKGMNKMELAEKMGITPQSVSHYLDSSNIGLEAIRKIAKALEVEPGDLIAVPHLTVKNLYRERQEAPAIYKPSKTTFVCPVCRHKLVATIESVGQLCETEDEEN